MINIPIIPVPNFNDLSNTTEQNIKTKTKNIKPLQPEQIQFINEVKQKSPPKSTVKIESKPIEFDKHESVSITTKHGKREFDNLDEAQQFVADDITEHTSTIQEHWKSGKEWRGQVPNKIPTWQMFQKLAKFINIPNDNVPTLWQSYKLQITAKNKK